MTAWKITYRPTSVTILPHQVEADYFRLEDGWFTFKTADHHKAVFAVNGEDVRSVERVEPAN